MPIDGVTTGSADPFPGYGNARGPVGCAGDGRSPQGDGEGLADTAFVVADSGDGYCCGADLFVVPIGDGIVVL